MNQLYEAMARYAQVLSNAKRVEILMLLGERKEMTPGDIAAAVSVTMPNLSQHLSLMKQYGLVTSRKAGLNQHYSLNGDIQTDVLRMIKGAVIAGLQQNQELLKAVGR